MKAKWSRKATKIDERRKAETGAKNKLAPEVLDFAPLPESGLDVVKPHWAQDSIKEKP